MSFPHFRLHPFLTDIATTAATQLAVFVSNIVVISLVSRSMGALVLAEFLLIKRASAWLLTGAQLGLGIALPREIAHCKEEMERRAALLFTAALVTVLAFVSGIGAAAVLEARFVARLLFGTNDPEMAYALLLLLLGIVSLTMAVGYYRGLQRILAANTLQMLGLAAIPVVSVVVFASRRSAALVIGANGTAALVISLIWGIPIIFQLRELRISPVIVAACQLLAYGLKRVPGDLAEGALLTIGPLAAAHYAAREEVAYLLLGLAGISASMLSFGAVGFVLLPKASRLFGTGRDADLKQCVTHIRYAVLQLAAIITTQALIFAKPIIYWWVGPAYSASIPVVSLILLSIPAYMYWAAMRNVIDAASAKAYNARNLIVTLSILLLLTAIVVTVLQRNMIIVGLAFSTTLAMYILATLTEIRLRKLGFISVVVSLQAAGIALALGCLSLAVQFAFEFNISKIAFAITQAANAILLAYMLRRTKPAWLMFALRTGFAARG